MTATTAVAARSGEYTTEDIMRWMETILSSHVPSQFSTQHDYDLCWRACEEQGRRIFIRKVNVHGPWIVETCLCPEHARQLEAQAKKNFTERHLTGMPTEDFAGNSWEWRIRFGR